MSVLSISLASGEKFTIRFEHRMARFYHNGVITPSGSRDLENKTLKVGEKEVYRVRRATQCTISAFLGIDAATKIRMEKVLAAEWAACHPKEPFRRAEGRKTSLHKTLKKMILSREQRRDIWFTYFTSVKNNPLKGDAEYEAWRTGGTMEMHEMKAEGTEDVTPREEPTTEETTTTPAEGDVTPGQATADVHGDVLGI